MKVVCWVVPIKPGKIEMFRNAMAGMEAEKRAEFAESERRCGIKREMWFVWETPERSYGVVFMQADDLEEGLRRFGESDGAYEVQARLENDDMFEYWPNPAWGDFPTPGVIELLSAYDAEDPSVNARAGKTTAQ